MCRWLLCVERAVSAVLVSRAVSADSAQERDQIEPRCAFVYVPERGSVRTNALTLWDPQLHKIVIDLDLVVTSKISPAAARRPECRVQR